MMIDKNRFNFLNFIDYAAVLSLFSVSIATHHKVMVRKLRIKVKVIAESNPLLPWDKNMPPYHPKNI